MEQIGANIPPIQIQPGKFAGQVAVITGAAQGIGEAVATLFAAQGAWTVLIDIQEQKLRVAEAKLASTGAKVLHRQCDLVNEEQVHTTINAIVDECGKIDIIVHLAGIYPAKPLLQVTYAEYRRIFQVNMDSTFFLTQAVLPHMQKAGYGRIINTSSQTVHRPPPTLGIYAASKSAVVGFTRAIAVEAGPGVTANVVSPTLIRSEGTKNSNELATMAIEQQIVKRSGVPRDVAHAITYIASPEAEFITGQVFDIGGGTIFN